MKQFLTFLGLIGLSLSCAIAQETYEQTSLRFNEHIENMIKQGELNADKSKRRDAVNATFTMTNPEVTVEGANNFFEFDIEASTEQENIFFDNALLRLDYSGINGNSVFGDSIAKRGNIEIEYGPLFNDANTYEQDLANDVDSQEVALIAGVHFMPPTGTHSRVILPKTPVQLLHVKIKMTACGKDVALTYHDNMLTLPSFFWSYAETADASAFDGTAFDNATFIDSIGLYNPPLIDGADHVCEGATESYSIESINAAQGYTWTTEPGGILSFSDSKIDLTLNENIEIIVKGNLGCGFSKSGNLEVEVDEQPIANAGPDTIICENNIILYAEEPNVGQGFWTFVSGNGIIQSANLPNSIFGHQEKAETEFILNWTVIGNGFCPDATDEITINYDPSSPNCTITGNEDGTVHQFVIAPNPVSDVLIIDIDEDISEIRILSMNGITVLEQNGNGHHTEIDLNALGSGVYMIQAVSNDSIYSGSFVKE